MATIAFTFDESTHAYVTEAGLRVPSVTQVLKRVGWVDFSQIAQDILENKRDLGLAVHTCTQYLDEGDLDDSTVLPAWVPYVEAWKKFKRECDVQILGIEQRNVFTVNGMPYGGTFDRKALVNGRESILEIKCSAARSEWWGIQLAAYDSGLPQCPNQLHRDRFAVQLRPDGTYRLWPFADDGDYEAWSWSLALCWLQLNRNYKLD